MNRKVLHGFTTLLVIVSGWTAYANVISDDTNVRAKARAVVGAAAGCGDRCRVTDLRGDRGMLEERLEYELVDRGHYVVVCRRAFIVVGDHACEVTEGNGSTTTRAR